jgi:hypothetical protein
MGMLAGRKATGHAAKKTAQHTPKAARYLYQKFNRATGRIGALNENWRYPR